MVNLYITTFSCIKFQKLFLLFLPNKLDFITQTNNESINSFHAYTVLLLLLLNRQIYNTA